VGTFGNNGAGTSVFWVDPESDANFVCLTTGCMPEWENIKRFQRYSDAVAAVMI
jgi:CubicO group peptidase (beta-lactamase class C family)